MSDTVFDLSDGRQITSSNTKFSELPNLVTKDNLIGVKIGNQVTSFSDIFKKCEKLKSVTFIPTSQVSVIGNYAFSSCTALQSVTIPDSVTTIKNYAFAYCTSLSSVTIPDSVTTIEGNVFRGCAMQSVTIPDSVTSIGERTFKDCDALQTVILGNGLTKIEHRTFEGCDVLDTFTIGNNVTQIMSTAFTNCDNLTRIYMTSQVANNLQVNFGVQTGEFFGAGASGPYGGAYYYGASDNSITFSIIEIS